MNQKTLRIIVFSVTACLLTLFAGEAGAQCSICTKTASQLGDGPAKALNGAILYLAGAPLAIMGYIGWRWWKTEKQFNAATKQTKTDA